MMFNLITLILIIKVILLMLPTLLTVAYVTVAERKIIASPSVIIFSLYRLLIGLSEGAALLCQQGKNYVALYLCIAKQPGIYPSIISTKRFYSTTTRETKNS